jgi:hypothetical protein
MDGVLWCAMLEGYFGPAQLQAARALYTPLGTNIPEYAALYPLYPMYFMYRWAKNTFLHDRYL